MVDIAFPKARGQGRVAYTIERLTEPARIRPWLEAEQAYAAYALGQLEPALFQRSRWWSCKGAKGTALAMVSKGGLGNALVAVGDVEALDALLSLHPGPRFAFATFRPEHLLVARRHYVLNREEPMMRMAVAGEFFQPAEGETWRLGGEDVAMVNRLYSTEGWPTFYSTRNLEDGVYYGVFMDKRLVAIAGTHVVAPSENTAVIGGVFTHPRYRNRGLSTIATSAVTQDLLTRCKKVFLTVESGNYPALCVYQRLGFREVCALYETPVIRRDPTGVLALRQRLQARWRGGSQRVEVIRK